MRHFDCIVVGAGPAGSTALRQLALAGVEACAIDRADFPRYKPCGGAISALTARELDFPWEDLVEGSLHRVELTYRHGRPIVCESEHPFARFVMRDRFDHRLLQAAVEAGGAFYANHAFESLEIDKDGVTVKTSRGEFRARAIIAADGANSRVAKVCGLFNHERGIAIEAEITPTPKLLDAYKDRVYLSYADPKWGYGWVFPKAERLSVGVGTFSKNRSDVKPAFQRLLQATGLSQLPMQLYGHPIPTGGAPRRIVTERVLLAGDAAGLNDPLSGEGIAHAVRSGKVAARHVIAALTSGDYSFEGYQRQIDESVVADLGRASWIAHKVYAFPRLFHWLLVKSPRTVELYFRLVRGEVDYKDLTRHLQEQFLRFGLFADAN